MTLSLVFLLAAEVAADPKLRGNKNTFHPAIDVLKSTMRRATDDELAALKKLPLESVWGALNNMGYTKCYFSGYQSSRPMEKVVGRAVTIRYLPTRPDLEKAMKQLAEEGDWAWGWHRRPAEEAQAGDVIVVDLGGEKEGGVFFGDISALGAKTKGATGVILYGASRDYAELREMEGLPVLALHWDPHPATQIGVDWNVPIRAGQATVLPGDVVVADAEAALFFPASIAPEVIRRATAQAEQEEFERTLVRENKHRFRDVYPPQGELRKRFEEEKKRKKP